MQQALVLPSILMSKIYKEKEKKKKQKYYQRYTSTSYIFGIADVHFQSVMKKPF